MSKKPPPPPEPSRYDDEDAKIDVTAVAVAPEFTVLVIAMPDGSGYCATVRIAADGAPKISKPTPLGNSLGRYRVPEGKVVVPLHAELANPAV